MPKVHFITTAERVIWGAGKDVHALCGADIEDALAVLDLDIRDWQLKSAKTIHLCGVCFLLALTPTSEANYIYGVLPKKAALLLNRESEEN